MEYNLIQNLQYCGQIVDELRNMLLYTHIPPAVVSLLVGSYVLMRTRTSAGKLLFAVSIIFALWVLTNLTIWLAYDYNSVLMFAWSLIGLLSSLLFILIFYFVYVFSIGRNVPLWINLFWTGVLLPVIFFTPTSFNLEGFDIRECIAVEGTWFTNYFFAVGILVVIAIALIPVFGRKYKAAHTPPWGVSALALLGAELFMVAFITTAFLASYLVAEGIVPDFGLEQYGIVVMAVFMVFLAYIIVRYRAFDVKLLGAQVLVTGLIILVAAEYLFAEGQINVILVTVTLLLTSMFGVMLVKNVTQEVRQREKIETLANELEVANARLKELDRLKTEFVSIASHQLRSPLAAIKGYASMLHEGSFGKLNVAAYEAVGRIFASSALMARSVEDFLNVSRIELGRMKYDLSNFDLCKLIEVVIDEQKPIAEEKKLKLIHEKDPSVNTCDVFADIGKIKQVVTNLVDNAIKYTPTGSVTVRFSRDPIKKTARVSVTDTGMGMSGETIKKLFAKFARADNANKVNVIGTGLGLYVARQLVEAHGGKIWAESGGEGQGSSFIIELPLEAHGEAVQSSKESSTQMTPTLKKA